MELCYNLEHVAYKVKWSVIVPWSNMTSDICSSLIAIDVSSMEVVQ